MSDFSLRARARSFADAGRGLAALLANEPNARIHAGRDARRGCAGRLARPHGRGVVLDRARDRAGLGGGGPQQRARGTRRRRAPRARRARRPRQGPRRGRRAGGGDRVARDRRARVRPAARGAAGRLRRARGRSTVPRAAARHAEQRALLARRREGRLQFLRCVPCGTWIHPPSPVCPTCYGKQLEVAAVSGLAHGRSPSR